MSSAWARSSGRGCGRFLVLLVFRPKHCERARYLIRVDEAFPITIVAFIDYRLREGTYIKYLRHLGNGTLDGWFSGAFALERSDATHELCVQVRRDEASHVANDAFLCF